jgi:hypothetical protein
MAQGHGTCLPAIDSLHVFDIHFRLAAAIDHT